MCYVWLCMLKCADLKHVCELVCDLGFLCKKGDGWNGHTDRIHHATKSMRQKQRPEEHIIDCKKNRSLNVT